MNGPGADWLAQVRTLGVSTVAAAFGLTSTRGRGLSPCPSCNATTRHPSRGDRRGAVGVRPDGAGWRCFQCEAGGDAVTLAVLLATGGREPQREDWPAVRRACAEVGLCDADPNDSRPPPVVRRLEPRPARVETPPARPPAAEVVALWGACLRLDAVPSWGAPEWCGDVRIYVTRRGLDCAWLAALDMARILPAPDRLTYPAWWPGTWTRSWRLVVQAFEPDGTLASLHARAVDDANPKTRWPRGCAAGGLLMGDPLGQAFLSSALSMPPPAVLVAEGLTDLLSWALWTATDWPGVPVLSITSGGAAAFARVRWPRGVPCYVATDNDVQGDRYAGEIRAALPAWVPVRRMHLQRVTA